jgi:hypothetical protein
MRVAFNSPARNQFVGESFNGRTAGLHPANESSTLSSSTNFIECDRGRVAQAADCGSVHEGSIPSGHPSSNLGTASFGRGSESAYSDSRSRDQRERSFYIRGLGKRINPLGLGPRDSRFESEVPDQILWGSQAARRLAVTQ